MNQFVIPVLLYTLSAFAGAWTLSSLVWNYFFIDDVAVRIAAKLVGGVLGLGICYLALKISSMCLA